MNHRNRISWRPEGKAVYMTFVKVPCGSCNEQGRWNDGIDWVSCRFCIGKGYRMEPRYTRVPEFDAPVPPKNWKPNE